MQQQNETPTDAINRMSAETREELKRIELNQAALKNKVDLTEQNLGYLYKTVSSVEKHFNRLEQTDLELSKTMNEINTTLALLNQTVMNIQEQQNEYKAASKPSGANWKNHAVIVVISLVVTAIGNFILGGGLTLPTK